MNIIMTSIKPEEKSSLNKISVNLQFQLKLGEVFEYVEVELSLEKDKSDTLDTIKSKALTKAQSSLSHILSQLSGEYSQQQSE